MGLDYQNQRSISSNDINSTEYKRNWDKHTL